MKLTITIRFFPSFVALAEILPASSHSPLHICPPQYDAGSRSLEFFRNGESQGVAFSPVVSPPNGSLYLGVSARGVQVKVLRTAARKIVSAPADQPWFGELLVIQKTMRAFLEHKP